jgi:hypothetical protein
MRPRLRLFLLLPLATLLACGSSSPTPTTPSGFEPVTGDYVLTVAPGTAAASTFTGALTVSGTNVTGVFQYNNIGTNCVSSGQDIAFTGSIVNSVLTLTSAAFSNSVATLTIQQFVTNTSGTSLASGTAVITGGTCALASTALQAALVPSFNATWSGTLNGQATGSVSLAITQSTSNADGQFPVSGIVTFGGSSCSFSVNGVTGLVRGYNLSLGAGSTAPNNQISVNLNSQSLPASLSISVFATTLGCPAGSYSGTVSH